MDDTRAKVDAEKLEWSAPQIDFAHATEAEAGFFSGGDSALGDS
ncbi:hypothetical protein [Brevundimonas sp.]|nr:hypothetical protein [Brevundimonas sp.]MDZ4363868.1 hypothetical protein [Brevundimonas sp.]